MKSTKLVVWKVKSIKTYPHENKHTQLHLVFLNLIHQFNISDGKFMERETIFNMERSYTPFPYSGERKNLF